jgi:hypothetical protein
LRFYRFNQNFLGKAPSKDIALIIRCNGHLALAVV